MTTPIATSRIVQQAFTELNLRPVSSYADDTPQAIEAAETYTEALDMVLEAYDWSFARRLVKLAQVTADADQAADADLPYTFSLPAATRTLKAVYPANRPDDRMAWRREGQQVRAAEADVQALITVNITREDELQATFRHVCALQLASLMAPRYAPTRAKSADLADKLREALYLAKQADKLSASQHRIDGLAIETGDDWVSQVTR